MTASDRWLRGRGKRVLDIAVAAPASVLLLPVALAVALVVRLRLGAPVLFRHERAGRHGEPIAITKFRTMTTDCDDTGRPLPDEQRLTPLGRALRGTSLDELPQLWSVLRGDMSIVGPRPLPVTYVDRYSMEQRQRLAVKPGLTGWAQVNGRNAVDWQTRLACDVWYVDHASLALDLRIIVRTVKVLFSRRGVSADGHATMPEFTGEV